MNLFDKKTPLLVSPEFSELVGLINGGEVLPVVDSEAKIVSIHECESGQRLFVVEFDAEVEDEDEDYNVGDDGAAEPRIVLPKTFPATVAQIQKMNKLWRKANPNGAVPKPNVSARVVELVVDEEINAASDDF